MLFEGDKFCHEIALKYSTPAKNKTDAKKVWKTSVLSQRVIVRSHVTFRGGDVLICFTLFYLYVDSFSLLGNGRKVSIDSFLSPGGSDLELPRVAKRFLPVHR